jgi:hypothetical protein
MINELKRNEKSLLKFHIKITTISAPSEFLFIDLRVAYRVITLSCTFIFMVSKINGTISF